MSRDSRRLFATPEMMTRISPPILWDFLGKFKDALAAEGFHLPPRSQSDKLDLPVLVHALAAAGRRGGVEINDLADALFFISIIATPKNRRLLEEEIAVRKPKPKVPDTLSDADYVVSVWLSDPKLLEAAAARATLTARRSFHYFIPSDLNTAAGIGPFTAGQEDALAAAMLAALKPDGRGRGLKIIPYLDSPDEDWFLIRRSRLPERITFHDDDGNEVSQSVWMRVYDVAYFDRRTGVLKVNARDRLEDVFRAAFGKTYASNPAFFDNRPIFTLDPLRNAAFTTLSCEGVSGLEHVALEETMYFVYEDGTLTKHVVGKKDWYAETGGRRAPIPADAQLLEHAKFTIRATGRKESVKCTLHEGNVLSISRDDESVAFETFLRIRGFMRHVQVLTRTAAA
jgi:hypothetical protein